MNEFEFIVVGAGSGGAALAGRLSENASASVLLLEEGPDYRSADTPAEVRSLDPLELPQEDMPAYTPPSGAALDQYFVQGLNARRTHAQEPTMMLRGRGVGGSSAINGLFAVRPTVEDLDGWAAAGASGWSFEEMLPLLNRLETDQDFGDAEYHGSAGPLPIVRPAGKEILPIDEQFAQAAQGLGHGWEPDHNAPGTSGVSPYAFNARDGMRYSTNDAYLEPARGRANLTIEGGVRVDRVLIEDGRAVGVVATREGSTIEYRAREVILAAGAVQSPAILMRSGVGPAAQLESLGIDVVADLPVGRNLQDHPMVSLVLNLRQQPEPQAIGDRPIRSCLRFGLGLSTEPSDGVISPRTHPTMGKICVLLGWLNRTVSTGEVRLASSDPAEQPIVDSNLLSDAGDMDRMRALVDEMVEITRQDGLKEVTSSIELAPLPGSSGGFAFSDRPAAEADLRKYILENVYDAAHISGTCRMGAPEDPRSVADPDGRVLGLEGLRIADASIFPWVPSANTHIAAVLAGEKIAESIRQI